MSENGAGRQRTTAGEHIPAKDLLLRSFLKKSTAESNIIPSRIVVRTMIKRNRTRITIQATIRIVLIVVFLMSAIPGVKAERYRFERLGLNDGLSQSTVLSILQDSRGFIWFGTQDGLNRYDGYDFRVYRYDRDNPGSISHNVIFAMEEDINGNIWIGTFNRGLNRYDRATDRFTHYLHDPEDPESLPNNLVFDVLEDNIGRIWVCTRNGLALLNSESGTFQIFRHRDGDPASISNSGTTCMLQDSKRTLWVGSNGGLNRMVAEDSDRAFRFEQLPSDVIPPGVPVTCLTQDSRNRLWVGTLAGVWVLSENMDMLARYTRRAGDPESLSNNAVRAIAEDTNGNIWIGTDRGLNILETGETGFLRLFHDPDDPDSLTSDMISSIYMDRSGVIFVGTQIGGINKFDPGKQKFEMIDFNEEEGTGLKDPAVFSLYEDSRGTIWIGTGDSVLHRMDPETLHIEAERIEPAGTIANNIRCIYEDSSGDFWVGTQITGLYRKRKGSREWTVYHNIPGDSTSLSFNSIRSIVEDREGRFWIATSGGGLNRMDRDTGTFTRYLHDPDDPDSLSSNFCRIMFEDSTGKLWVCTNGGGLNCLDPETGHFTRFTHDPDDPFSISNDYVFSIFEDAHGILWVGTFGGGLCRFDPKTGRFTTYTTDDGLPNDVVYGILEDDGGNLWLSTNNGLSRFNPETGEFTNYGIDDGLQSAEFNGGAYFEDSTGRFYFGGVSGLNIFRPDEITDNMHVPPVAFTDFLIFNQSPPIGGDSPLKHHINETDHIVLYHWDKSFSFRFAALDFRSPDKNQYRYKMVGFDGDWVNAGTRNFVTYTNLGSGDYTFVVQGSNNDGVWNTDGHSIRVTIEPPPWKTWWFLTLMVLAVAVIVLLWYRRNARTVTMRTMIRTAHDTQMSIMPESDPRARNFDISAICLPTYEVSGDFYDYVWMDEDRNELAILVGDVSGKGMKAAMNALMANGMIYSELTMNSSLREVMELVNIPVYRKTDRNTFTAMCLLTLNEDTRTLTFVNAGLNEPVLISGSRGNDIKLLKSNGSRLPLGALPENDYAETTVSLESGNVLLFFTDGIIEARNSKQFYGYEGLTACLKTVDLNRTADDIRNMIIRDVERFVGANDQHDDITLIVIKVR